MSALERVHAVSGCRIAMLCLVATVTGCVRQPGQRIPQGTPVVDLYIAGDAARIAEFVLYDTGWLISSRPSGDGRSRMRLYYAADLSAIELQRLRSSLEARRLEDLESAYDLAATASDVGWTVISVQPPWTSTARRITVRGFDLQPFPGFRPDPPPEAFARAVKVLRSFRSETERPWIPDRIEVDLYPSGDKDAPCRWPEGWPLRAPQAPSFQPQFVGSAPWLLDGIALNEVTDFLDRCDGRSWVEGRPYRVFTSVSVPGLPGLF